MKIETKFDIGDYVFITETPMQVFRIETIALNKDGPYYSNLIQFVVGRIDYELHGASELKLTGLKIRDEVE